MLKTIPDILESIPVTIRKLSAEQGCRECADSGGVRIDVREAQEAQNDPINGSINIPRGVLEMNLLQRFPDAAKPIYLHCATGARATLAAEALMRLGYENVTVIACGLDDLKQEAEKH